MLALFIIAAVAYGAATYAYGSQPDHSSGGGDDEPTGLGRYGRLLLAVAALFHMLAIGAQCVDGDHPLKNIFLALSFGALIAVGGYLGLSRGRNLDALGPLMAPLGLSGLVLGVVFSKLGSGPTVPGAAGVATAHVAFASIGFAGFTLAAGIAGLYLVMERRLQRKVFRPGASGMSLSGLDRLHHRLVLMVTPVFTLAIVTGVLWVLDVGGWSQLAGRSFEVAAAAIAWLCSSGLLISRAVWGTRGRRAALLTLVAFGALLLIVGWYGVNTA
jgi:ABC-type uncharacterized transport system permease subunit